MPACCGRSGGSGNDALRSIHPDELGPWVPVPHAPRPGRPANDAISQEQALWQRSVAVWPFPMMDERVALRGATALRAPGIAQFTTPSYSHQRNDWARLKKVTRGSGRKTWRIARRSGDHPRHAAEAAGQDCGDRDLSVADPIERGGELQLALHPTTSRFRVAENWRRERRQPSNDAGW